MEDRSLVRHDENDRRILEITKKCVITIIPYRSFFIINLLYDITDLSRMLISRRLEYPVFSIDAIVIF